MPNIKGVRMSLSAYLLEDMAAILSDSFVARTPPRAVPLATVGHHTQFVHWQPPVCSAPVALRV